MLTLSTKSTYGVVVSCLYLGEPKVIPSVLLVVVVSLCWCNLRSLIICLNGCRLVGDEDVGRLFVLG